MKNGVPPNHGGTPTLGMMKSQRYDYPVETNVIGETALRVLSNAQHGTVLASVTNATYLRSEKGELCWLIPATGQMHQRGIQIIAPLPRLNVGSWYEVVDQTILTRSNEKLDFRHAPIWKSPTITSTDIVSISRLSRSLLTVVDHLLKQSVPSGLGCLISSILQMTSHKNEALEVNLDSWMAEKAWPAVQGMILASKANDTKLIINYAKSLVGLGEGLTPSGDDFLGGFFFSRQFLYEHYPKALNLSTCTYSDFILQLKPLTNLISYTILKDHADGQSVEPLHQFANGLLQGKPVDQLFLHVEKLISLGHSSGWDLLSGFLAGMTISFNK